MVIWSAVRAAKLSSTQWRPRGPISTATALASLACRIHVVSVRSVAGRLSGGTLQRDEGNSSQTNPNWPLRICDGQSCIDDKQICREWYTDTCIPCDCKIFDTIGCSSTTNEALRGHKVSNAFRTPPCEAKLCASLGNIFVLLDPLLSACLGELGGVVPNSPHRQSWKDTSGPCGARLCPC